MKLLSSNRVVRISFCWRIGEMLELVYFFRMEEVEDYVVCSKSLLCVLRSVQGERFCLELSPMLDRWVQTIHTHVHT